MSQMIDNKHLEVLLERLTLESNFLLRTLYREKKKAINKIKLEELTNELFAGFATEYGRDPKIPLINSRFTRDLHTSRLDAAGLVDIEEIGRVRMYRISELGIALMQHLKRKLQEAGE